MPPDIIEALVKTIELKDLCTAAHTWRVVLYTRAMGEAFGVPGAVLERLTIGAALHDLGKLDVPDEILRKPGPLTEAEFAVIRTHPVTGHDRLVRMGETDPIVLGLVRSHHERPDGKGYPDRLAGEAIPEAARYFAVIDSFDAMTSLRPYRHAAGPGAVEGALDELHRGVGTRYCAACVEAFVRLYRSGDLKWILEYFNDTMCATPYAAGAPARQSPRPGYLQ